jgi:hypothetical protein
MGSATATMTSPRSLLDFLNPDAIPAGDHLGWQPEELVAVLGEHKGRHWGMVRCVSWRPNGKQIVSGGDDLFIRIWDAESMQEWAVLYGHTRPVLAVAFSPDGKTLISGSADKTVRVWDLSGEEPKEGSVLTGHRNDVAGYAANLERFDLRLTALLPQLRDDDLLVITADHGNDPTTPSTDHAREYVPLLVTGARVRAGHNLGTRATFADLAQTLAELFAVGPMAHGTSFLKEITT